MGSQAGRGAEGRGQKPEAFHHKGTKINTKGHKEDSKREDSSKD
jgi:hypothetical protein